MVHADEVGALTTVKPRRMRVGSLLPMRWTGMGTLVVLLVAGVAAPAAHASSGLGVVDVERNGLGGVTDLQSPIAVAVSPGGDSLYAAGFGGTLVAFQRDLVTGMLAFNGSQLDGVAGTDGLAGAAGVAISPDGKNVYVAAALDDAVAVFQRDPSSGVLTFFEQQKHGVAGVDVENAWSITVSPDGKNVYVGAYHPGAVAAFARDALTGALTFLTSYHGGPANADGLFQSFSVKVSPDGAFVYVAGRGANCVVTLARDATSGLLTWVETLGNDDTFTGLSGADGVAVSDDGLNVYVVSNGAGAVNVFARNALTGRLTLVEWHHDPISGGAVDGLYGATDVAVSPDGARVYVSGSFDSALVVFDRNALTGALTYHGIERQGVAGIDSLLNVSAAAVSPDSRHVYAVGPGSNTLTAFAATTCGNGIPEPGEDCEDGNGVSDDGCDANCTPTGCGNGIATSGEQCDDGNADENDCCLSSCTFSASGSACPVDGTACTADVCDGSGTCVHPPTPRTPCRVPVASGKAKLLLKHGPSSAKNALSWKWARGAITPVAAFGDPRGGDYYELCIFAAATSVPTTLVSMVLSPGGLCPHAKPCWKGFGSPPGAKGFTYNNPAHFPFGLQKVVLKAGLEPGKASILIKASGAFTPIPAFGSIPLPVRAQLVSSTGECWEATYGSPARNASGQFKAKAD